MSIERNRVTTDDAKLAANPAGLPRFFQKVDWVSFGVTTLLALAVYLFTLSPEVDLDYSGFYSTAAMYPGVSISPGHPLWAIYGWLFIKLLPFSNIAWRLGAASAVAGALACGLIALMVSRVGVLAAENISSFKNLLPNEEKSLRAVCSCVAGLGFGFDSCFWCKTVVADAWPLSLLLFALTICLMTRWVFAPQRRRFLYAAVLVHGLTLSESQALIPATFGLPFLLAMGERKLGREIFFGISFFLWGVLVMNNHLHQFGWYIGISSRNILICAAVITTLMWGILSFKTRRFFSEWKTSCLCGVLFLAGISACFLLPIFSMTTPPMNWGYPRTVEGFFHVITRGQFESLSPTDSFGQLIKQLGVYGKIADGEFGIIYLIAAVIPFCLLHKISASTRKWLVGLLVAWISISLLMLVGLNPGSDKASVDVIKPIFAASHLILAIFAGCGLMLVGAFVGRPATAESGC